VIPSRIPASSLPAKFLALLFNRFQSCRGNNNNNNNNIIKLRHQERGTTGSEGQAAYKRWGK